MTRWYDLLLMALCINIPLFLLRNKYDVFRVKDTGGMLSLAALGILVYVIQLMTGCVMHIEVSFEQLREILIASCIFGSIMAGIYLYWDNYGF